MAITWDITITNVNLTSKRGTITAVRTDSVSALAPRTYSMQNTPLETPDQRANALATIKEWDETAVANAASVEAFLDTLEQAAKNNLEAWELTR